MPLQRSGTAKGGVGDVGDVHLWLNGGMERGHAKSSHHRGLARCQVKGKKECWLAGTPATRSCGHTRSHWGGIHKVGGGVHLDVGVLGLATRLVRMVLSSWSMVAGRGVRCKNLREECRNGVPSTNLWPTPSPQDKNRARGCAGQCELPEARGRGMLPRPLHHPPQVPPTDRSPPPFGGGRRGGLGSAPRCR